MKKIITYRNLSALFCKALVVFSIITFFSAGIISEHDIEMDKVKISVDNDQGNRFVDENVVKDLFISYMGGKHISTIKNINLASLEQVLESEPHIHQAELYVSMLGDLHIDIEQHNPVVRLIDKLGKSVYITEKGHEIPVSKTFTARVPVATGNYLAVNKQAKNNVLALAQKINEDDWFFALTQQILVDEDGQLSVIPVVGDFVIGFGDGINLDAKLKRLKAFYVKGLNNGIGWDKYSKIHVGFDKQVVCTKK